jgi:hypothetical protein
MPGKRGENAFWNNSTLTLLRRVTMILNGGSDQDIGGKHGLEKAENY